MKKLMVILAAAMMLTAVITASAQTMPKIHVEGNNFVDENGKTIVFKGLCFSDPVKLIGDRQWVGCSKSSFQTRQKSAYIYSIYVIDI